MRARAGELPQEQRRFAKMVYAVFSFFPIVIAFVVFVVRRRNATSVLRRVSLLGALSIGSQQASPQTARR